MLIHMLKIECMEVGPFQANCYLVWGPARRALVLDPGAEADTILDALNHHRLEVAAYLVSHGHMDHISALAALYEQRPAPYALHAADCQWAFTPANQAPPYYMTPRQPAASPLFLQNGQLWTPAEDLVCRVIATPGHSPGSLCFYFEDNGVLFSGDTLFQGSVGRTDLPGGDGALLTQSLKTLARLSPATRLYPGHGSHTTLAKELRSNPYLTDHG